MISGEFYEYFEQEALKRIGKTYTSRNEVKAEMFLVLFSANGYINRIGTEGKQLFKELFPSVYKLFSMINELRDQKFEGTNLTKEINPSIY